MTLEMSKRDRVLCALQHREPDRVPVAFDSPESSIHKVAHKKLLEYLKFEVNEGILIDRALQVVRPDDRVKQHFKTDTYCVVLAEGDLYMDPTEDAYIDEWGIHLKASGEWYSIVDSPLKRDSLDELRHLPIPDPSQGDRAVGLAEEARMAADAGYFVHAGGPWGIFEISSNLRGAENLYIDMIQNPDYVEALAERVLEHHFVYYQVLLDAIGETIDAISVSDDLGGQENLLFSPSLFRRIYKPRLARLIEHIRKLAPDIYIYMHSDGAIFEIIPDLIEIGIDALNPIQFTAKGMDPKRLKQTFGRDLAFWGGGIDNKVLSFGTPDEVQLEVRNKINILGPRGGYVFATVHNISAEVPPENIDALFQAAHQYGTYPLPS